MFLYAFGVLKQIAGFGAEGGGGCANYSLSKCNVGVERSIFASHAALNFIP